MSEARTYLALINNLPKTCHPEQNLHISAHRLSCRTAKQQGSKTLHYRPIRLRGLRTLIGKAAIKTINYVNTISKSSTNIPIYLDTQSQLLQSWQLNTAAKINPDSTYLISNTNLAKLITDLPDQSANIAIAPELSRDTIIRAFIWMLATYQSNHWNSPRLLQLLAQAANLNTRNSLYQLCFDEDYVTSELAIRSHADADFWTDFLNEISTNDSSDNELLRQSYITASKYLPRDQKPIYFVGAQNDNTSFIFQEFMRLHRLSNQITAWSIV